MRPCCLKLRASLTRASAALLYTPFSLLFARSARGDVLLPEPRRQRHRGVRECELLASEEPVPSVGDEQLGRRLRRLLEHHVGSEARGKGVGSLLLC